jgi:hypothetical protein
MWYFILGCVVCVPVVGAVWFWFATAPKVTEADVDAAETYMKLRKL